MNPTPSPPRPAAPAPGQLPVELPDAVAEGTYSNLMFITHSSSEFILDFARALPGTRKGKVYSRIVTTPQQAKALSEMLKRNITLYEEKNGTIKLAGQESVSPTIGFSPGVSEPARTEPSEKK